MLKGAQSPVCNMFLFSLQGDDGPDVRGGSGDILLVHATETDRKGTVNEREQAGSLQLGVAFFWLCSEPL